MIAFTSFISSRLDNNTLSGPLVNIGSHMKRLLSNKQHRWDDPCARGVRHRTSCLNFKTTMNEKSCTHVVPKSCNGGHVFTHIFYTKTATRVCVDASFLRRGAREILHITDRERDHDTAAHTLHPRLLVQPSLHRPLDSHHICIEATCILRTQPLQTVVAVQYA